VSAVDVRTKQFSWNPPFVKDFPVSSCRFTAGPFTGGAAGLEGLSRCLHVLAPDHRLQDTFNTGRLAFINA
jgi:hypothetical protein